MFSNIADIYTISMSEKLLVSLANLQFSSLYNILDCQKKSNIAGFLDVDFQSIFLPEFH